MEVDVLFSTANRYKNPGVYSEMKKNNICFSIRI